jgi:hypothetical protein
MILGLVVPEGQAAKQKLLTAGKTAFFFNFNTNTK